MASDIFEKSKLYIKEGKLEKAQIILRRLLDENPNQASALELFGDLAWKLGNNEEAVRRYERVYDIYAHESQHLEAIVCLEKILRLNRDKKELILSLAHHYRSIDFPNEAVKRILELCTSALNRKEEGVFISGLKEIVNMQPQNLPLRFSLAKILYSLNRSQEAQDELQRLKTMVEATKDASLIEEINKLLPQYDGGDEELDPKSRIELGKLLYEIGSKDEALVEFNKAVEDLLKSGDKDEAIKVLNRIVEIDPNNNKAVERLKELKKESEPAAAQVPESSIEIPGLEELAEKEEAPAEKIEEIADIEQLKADAELIEEKAAEVTPVEPSVEEISIDQLISEPESPTEQEAVPSSDQVEAQAEEIPIEQLTTSAESVGETAAGLGPKEDELPGIEELTKGDEMPEKDNGAEGVDFLQGLSEEVEGFVAATEEAPVSETPGEELPPLEGQIADIEFLLKEAEARPSVPSFEISKAFEDFQNNILWVQEAVDKKMALALRAFDAELYETTLEYILDFKDQKESWPQILELIGGAMVKLGRYNETIKYISPAIVQKDLAKEQKLELRYILALAYEGLGDFENALREIEQIMVVDPNYKDVVEIYDLLGGKKVFEPKPRVEERISIKREVTPPPAPRVELEEKAPPVELKEKAPPVQKEPKPGRGPEKLPEILPDEVEEEERISFL